MPRPLICGISQPHLTQVLSERVPAMLNTETEKPLSPVSPHLYIAVFFSSLRSHNGSIREWQVILEVSTWTLHHL